MSVYGYKMSPVFGKRKFHGRKIIFQDPEMLTEQHHESYMPNGLCVFILPELPMPPSTY